MTTIALHIVLGIYCTSHYIYTKIQAKFLSNQDERAPLVASEAIRVPLGHFALCDTSWTSVTKRRPHHTLGVLDPRRPHSAVICQYSALVIFSYPPDVTSHSTHFPPHTIHTRRLLWHFTKTAPFAAMKCGRCYIYHMHHDLRGNLVTLLVVQRMDRLVPGTWLSCHVMVWRKGRVVINYSDEDLWVTGGGGRVVL